MLKGPVKQLLTQRRLPKTRRVEARRTRASGQVGSAALEPRAPPGVGEAAWQGADASLNLPSVHVGEFRFSFFEWSHSFSF